MSPSFSYPPPFLPAFFGDFVFVLVMILVGCEDLPKGGQQGLGLLFPLFGAWIGSYLSFPESFFTYLESGDP